VLDDSKLRKKYLKNCVNRDSRLRDLAPWTAIITPCSLEDSIDPARSTSSHNGIQASCTIEAGLELQYCTHDLSCLFKPQAIHSMVEEPNSEDAQGGCGLKMENTVWDTTKQTGTNVMESVSRRL